MPPREEYTRRLAERRATADHARRREDRAANARLLVFGVVLLVFWLTGSVAWSLLPFAAFLATVFVHGSLRRAREHAERAVLHYERGLARLAHEFAGMGDTGERLAPGDEHPYAVHLDLFGAGSLFELLCSARTAAGQETLAAWLLAPAPPQEISARHAAVRELRERLDLREELATLEEETVLAMDSGALAAWGEAPSAHGELRTARIGAFVLSIAFVATVATVRGWPLLAVLVLGSALGLLLAKRVRKILDDVRRPCRDLALVAQLMTRLDREAFSSPRLLAIHERLDAEERLRQLQRLVDMHDWRLNLLFAPLSPFLLWATQWALAIEAWRVRYGARLRDWLGAVGEVEALLDLAGYAYERPDDVFPEVGGAARFVAEGLAHPLLRDAVRNDVRVDEEMPMWIVTGSNMSGKSTLLRTVGINAVLAQAGAPVHARTLEMSSLQVAASIRTLDSLQAGMSRFYAEISGMRRMVELTGGELPVLVLLDELLHGTNSHDRRAGASALTRGLIERGALGLITTHDLALARLEQEHAPRVRNAHFDCKISNGELRFDYRLHEGVVQTSNALDLMRAIGLDV